MRASVLELIQRLRADGVAISVAETLDAMAALRATGVEREILREALAATLIKQEEFRPLFDATFATLFAAPPLPGAERGRSRVPRGGAPEGGAGHGGSAGGSGSATPGRIAPRPEDEPTAAHPPSAGRTASPPSPASPPSRRAAAPAPRRTDETARGPSEREARQPIVSPTPQPATSHAPLPAGDRGNRPDPSPPRPPSGAQAGPQSRAAALPRRPFAEIDADARDAALAAARELGRRFLARTSRRELRRKRGRVDIRRTIRAAISRGGVPLDLHRRGRRPGRPRLVALCDVSGSVSLAADLLLALLAAAEGAFAEVRRYAFVDHLVEVEFVEGRLTPAAPIDLWARSDHGRVLAELEACEGLRLDRHTVLLVLGDARSNRLPARADVLRRLAHTARAVIWVVPEPRGRWNTGDSALAAYAPHCDLVLEALDLAGLARSVRAAAQA